MVQMLLQTPGVRLMDFAQNEAYSRRLPFLAPVTLPRGVVDLAADVPPAGRAPGRTHDHAAGPARPAPGHCCSCSRRPRCTARQRRLVQPGARVPDRGQRRVPAGQGGRAHDPQRRAAAAALPALPLANLLERMWLSLGIILALLLPLSRIVPPLYEFRIRSRVFRWYAQLRDIEEQADQAGPDMSPDSLLRELDALEARVGKVVVPLSHTDELYALRNHIELVRRKLLRT
jgi:hypothetical protein